MAEGTVHEAAIAMEGRVIGDPQQIWSGATLDSRKVVGSELFFALPGEKSDGHRFVESALARGAAAAVVQQDLEVSGGTLIRVDDTFEALHALTRSVRSRTPRHLVAVTGSAGKTTTKELLSAMLAERFKVARNPGNFNNLLGFPVSLLGVAEDAEWMVAEMGMSTPGELGRVSRLGRPDVAVFTNVRPVHLEFFDSVSAIADAKAELLEGLIEGGTVVANADDPEVMRIVAGHDGRTVLYGFGPSAQYRASDVAALEEPRVGSHFRFTTPAGAVTVELPLVGRYNIENFLAAAACSHVLGVDLDRIVAAAAEAAPANQRGVVHRLPGSRTVLDESYNSNPDACAQALEAVAGLPATRHLAVLGDMLELGPDADRYHREVGVKAAALDYDLVVGVGELSQSLVAAAREAGSPVEWFETAEAALEVTQHFRAGDLVLVKGSRGIGLERVVAQLLKTESR